MAVVKMNVTDPNSQTGAPDESATRVAAPDQDRIGKAVAQAMGGDLRWQVVDGVPLTPEETAIAVDAIAQATKTVEQSKQQAAAAAQRGTSATTQSGYGNVEFTNTGTKSPGTVTAQALGLPPDATKAQIAAAAIAQNVATSTAKGEVPEVRVLRPGSTGIKTKKYTGPAPVGPRYGVSLLPSAPISAYKGEYGSKVEDTEFRDWIKRRAVVLSGANPENTGLLLSAGATLWNDAGEFVAANPQLRSTKTPEQWLDNLYQMAGGDAAYEAAIAEQTTNPITHNRQVSSYTVNAATAQAMINNMSEALLGRMASDAELKKARASVQKLLTPTVTNTTTDATDPANIQTRSHTKAGVGPQEAQALLEMRMKRGSEGMAMNVGQMFEAAMARM